MAKGRELWVAVPPIMGRDTLAGIFGVFGGSCLAPFPKKSDRVLRVCRRRRAALRRRIVAVVDASLHHAVSMKCQ